MKGKTLNGILLGFIIFLLLAGGLGGYFLDRHHKKRYRELQEAKIIEVAPGPEEEGDSLIIRDPGVSLPDTIRITTLDSSYAKDLLNRYAESLRAALSRLKASQDSLSLLRDSLRGSDPVILPIGYVYEDSVQTKFYRHWWRIRTPAGLTSYEYKIWPRVQTLTIKEKTYQRNPFRLRGQVGMIFVEKKVAPVVLIGFDRKVFSLTGGYIHNRTSPGFLLAGGINIGK
jgi:hypothetical protein